MIGRRPSRPTGRVDTPRWTRYGTTPLSNAIPFPRSKKWSPFEVNQVAGNVSESNFRAPTRYSVLNSAMSEKAFTYVTRPRVTRFGLGALSENHERRLTNADSRRTNKSVRYVRESKKP